MILVILSTKNSFIQNPCSNNHEITGLRSSHNNITLFVIILFMGIGKWIYLSRLYYVYEGNIKLDVIPFVYEIETIKNLCYYGNNQSYNNCTIDDNLIEKYSFITGNIRTRIQNISVLFKNETFGYNFIEKSYIIGWAISSFEIIILFFILKFMCFSSGIFIKKNRCAVVLIL